MLKTRSSALLSLILVFLSGTLVGAVSYRLYMVNSVASGGAPPGRGPGKFDPEEVRKRRVQEMKEKVKLDDEQVARLNVIYDNTRVQFDALKKRGDSEAHGLWEKQRDAVRAILRPEQLPLYEQHLKELDEMRKRRMREGKDGKR
jgi:Spy/CpxP family protein refolding chaperone